MSLLDTLSGIELLACACVAATSVAATTRRDKPAHFVMMLLRVAGYMIVEASKPGKKQEAIVGFRSRRRQTMGAGVPAQGLSSRTHTHRTKIGRGSGRPGRKSVSVFVTSWGAPPVIGDGLRAERALPAMWVP